ncbi:hypothetical protein [Halomonas stenophila]|uniref:Ribosomal protein S27AE n=1 Tax=Halomonas stenophila TaxID=795312 RepID=A0A7W5EX11_9GAMM|nr:hypothetical protein [Halomonas stenophila]MBB3232246.1 ribosomal protein S27AE [Halomonas stenophila]
MMTGHVIYGVGKRRSYSCRPLDEQALFRQGADPDRLMPLAIVQGEDSLSSEDLPELPLIDYELMLAHLYVGTFGATIDQNVDCPDCGKKFSVAFSLNAWVGGVRRAVAPDEGRAFDGAPYALPTWAILKSVKRDRSALASRLWQGETALPPERIAAFEAHVARACPILADDIEAPCPRCGEVVRKRFVLRNHLASRLRTRLRALLSDIHVLASSYHWSAVDILDLPRQTRVALIDTIQLQRRRAHGSR